METSRCKMHSRIAGVNIDEVPFRIHMGNTVSSALDNRIMAIAVALYKLKSESDSRDKISGWNMHGTIDATARRAV